MVNKVDMKDPKQSHSLSNRYELDNIDMALLRHLAKFPDTPHAHLAKLVGIQRSAVSKRMKKEAFKRAWDEVLADTKSVMQKNALMAAKRLAKLIQHDDDEIALNAIKVALAPWVQQQLAMANAAPVIMNTVKTYETTVSSDGSLVQQMIEAEVSRGAHDSIVVDIEAKAL